MLKRSNYRAMKRYAHSPGKLFTLPTKQEKKKQENEVKKLINENDTGLQIIRFIRIILLAWLKYMS